MYRRNRNLEARFNFKFKEVLDEGLDTATSRARTSILAGGNEYDMITLTTAGSLPLVQEGLMNPVTALPHVNLDKPYWNQQLNSDFTIMGKKYFAHGAHDISNI